MELKAFKKSGRWGIKDADTDTIVFGAKISDKSYIKIKDRFI